MPATPFLPIAHPVIEAGPAAVMTLPWQAWARSLQTIVVGLNVIPGVNIKTMAELNALGLGAADEGYVAWETSYGHALRWTGTVWQFAPGDSGNKFKSDYLGTPQGVGWALMDGSATDYLGVGGATLIATPVTLPNLTGSPAFHKSIAAYTGTIETAIAAVITGSTGSAAPGLSGSTGSGGSHDHSFSDTSSGPSETIGVDLGGFIAASDAHTHSVSGTTSSDGAHTHAAGTLAVNSHTHDDGTLVTDTAARPPSIGWLPYFRR